MSSRSVRTRAALQEAALALFEEQGYDETTVAQIAAGAGVSQMTFFRYFPTKESVVVDDPYDPVIGDLVADQPLTLSAMERTRLGLLLAWGQIGSASAGATRVRIRLVAGHPGLRAATVAATQRTEAVIVDALVRTGTPRAEAVVAAGACLGALTATLLDWGADEDESVPLAERILAALAQLRADQ